MIQLLAANKHTKSVRELSNLGHIGWTPSEYPEWLLLEVEQKLLIRPVQVKVAKEMISPNSQSSSLLQLSMGMGKSKLISPMVLSALANGQHLARAIVLRPLFVQMHETLTQRLGGLISRKIVHLPFSRATKLNRAAVATIAKLYAECASEGGVLLTTPESLLSLQLLGPDKLANPDTQSIRQKLMDLQIWLGSFSRDLCDESDEVLSVVFEQVYTNGQAVKMDASPERWLMIQSLYDVLSTHSRQLAIDYPEGAEHAPPSNGAFPSSRILHEEAGDELLSRIANDVVKGAINGLGLYHYDDRMKEAVRSFILDRQVNKHNYLNVLGEFKGAAMTRLFIVRGALAHRLLLFPLESRRHNAQYRLHTERCLNAVPYSALFSPSPSASFGHQDVMVATTVVSWYYDGLQDQQLRQAIWGLLDCPGRDDLWPTWSKSSNSPRKYHALKNINLDDAKCFSAFKIHLSGCKEVLDFFMNKYVFPREGIQYGYKLQKCYSDLVKPPGGPITTGFSGTNDMSSLLPRNIEQRNMELLSSTDAAVLTDLLADQNREYVLAENDGSKLKAQELLELVAGLNPSVSCLIDAGAQVITRSNRETAKLWLEFANDDKQAAVYFDEHNIKMVVSRAGDVEPFVSSRYRDNLRSCLVYLSNSQTRGVDMSLPDDFRAALTLGPRLGRDKMVQAALRLRKLGYRQSLCYVAPPEIDYQIRRMRKNHNRKVSAADMLKWSMSVTCQTLTGSRPLHILRSINHIHRTYVLNKYLHERN